MLNEALVQFNDLKDFHSEISVVIKPNPRINLTQSGVVVCIVLLSQTLPGLSKLMPCLPVRNESIL